MRPKRTVKPTQIFDNSVNTTSRNNNKQKTVSKNNKNDSVMKDGTIVGDDDNVFGINTEESEKENTKGMVNDDKFMEVGKENQNEHNSEIRKSQIEEISSSRVDELMSEGLRLH
nr:hypothetical protein [Tanacetum cinerariifolium]